MNERAKISSLTPEQASSAWPVLSPYLEKAVGRSENRVKIDHVREGVESGQVLVLVIWDPEQREIFGVLTAEGEQYPLTRVFAITLCGGQDIKEWIHLYPAVREIASQLGFDSIEIVGRAGWKKLLAPYINGHYHMFVDSLRDMHGLRAGAAAVYDKGVERRKSEGEIDG